MTTKWDSGLSIKFIQEYKARECLWHFKSPNHKNRARRKVALQELVDVMNIPGFTILDARNKIKNLRSTYCQEKKKIEKSKQGDSTVYEPTLKWYYELDELYQKMESFGKVPCDTKTPSQSTSVSNTPKENNYTDFETVQFPYSMELYSPKKEVEDPIDPKIEPEDLDSDFDDFVETENVQKEEEPPNKKQCFNTQRVDSGPSHSNSMQSYVETPNKYNPSSYDSYTTYNENVKSTTKINEATSSMIDSKSSSVIEDEQFDLFGKTVAVQLKKLSFERALIAQSKIQNILSELGIEEIREKNLASAHLRN